MGIRSALKEFNEAYNRVKKTSLVSADHTNQFLDIVRNIPKDPNEFYKDFGFFMHPRTGKPVPKLAGYQSQLWKKGYSYKYRLVIKSNKIGLTTSSLLELFYHMITDCAGMEALVFAQTFKISRDHIRTLRRMILQSDKYRRFLISHQEEGLLKDDVTKVSEIVLRNPYDRYKPSRIMGLGVAASSAVSWKEVKYVLFSDITRSGQDYRETLHGALTRLTMTEGYFLIETIPGKIGDPVYELVQNAKFGTQDEDEEISPELTFNYTEIPASQAVDAGVIREEWLDAQRSKLGKMFSKYYECQWITEGGRVVKDYELEDIKILGQQMEGTFDPASKDYPKAIGVDYASGSSKTAIVGLCYVDDKLVVTYSQEFEDPDYNEMVAVITSLAEGDYNGGPLRKTPIYIDGHNRDFIKSLRQSLSLNIDPHPKSKHTCSDLSELYDFGQVVPINFGALGIQMLSHLRHIASEGILAIDPAEHPTLIHQMTVAEHRDNLLQKTPNISYDSLDALRLALLVYEFIRE
jgi:hypothetical protein